MIQPNFQDIVKALGADPAARASLLAGAKKAWGNRKFVPLPGPQTDAYYSEADILLYGGSSGSAKSSLLIGLAVNEHTNSVIFRRESSQTDGLEAFGKQVIGDSARFNGTDLAWTWPDGRGLKLAGMQNADDWRKHAGRERDFIGFDEAGEFLEVQVSSIMAWLRAEPGKRCQLVMASNPPRDNDGAWMIEWFAPWLDPQFSNPAAPGELRWAVMHGGKTVWVDSKAMVEIEGEMYLPMSRTFIPASLDDNPYRNTPEYRARLQSLQEPLRSQLLYGDFTAGTAVDAWQAIPTDWVRKAQERWTKQPPMGIPMCAMGVDISQGGADEFVIAQRHDGWFPPLIAIPGKQVPDGKVAAGFVIANRRDNATVIVDIGGGWGGDCYAHLRENKVDAISYMGIKKCFGRTADGTLPISNIRSQAYWQLREALDPSQPGGSPISLPHDTKLVADLCSPKWKIGSQGIEIESKESVCKKLGRSTDRGDAVVMAWYRGLKQCNIKGGFEDYENYDSGRKSVQVITKKPR